MKFLGDFDLEEHLLAYPSPLNPRLKGLTSDEPSIKTLADSIKKNGQLQRIIVQKVGSRYEPVDGDRRCVAIFRVLKWKTIQASVYEMDELEAARLRLIANLQKEELTPIEKGKYCSDLFRIIAESEKLDPEKAWDNRITKSRLLREIAIDVGVHPSTIINWVGLWNNYPPEAQNWIASNKEDLRRGLVTPSLAISAARLARKVNINASAMLKMAIDNHWAIDHVDYLLRLAKQKRTLTLENLPELIQEFRNKTATALITFEANLWQMILKRSKESKIRCDDYVNFLVEFAFSKPTELNHFIQERIRKNIRYST